MAQRCSAVAALLGAVVLWSGCGLSPSLGAPGSGERAQQGADAASVPGPAGASDLAADERGRGGFDAAAAQTLSDGEYGAEVLAALDGAVVGEPRPGGYDRALFGYGPSEALDDDGCSTRQRVLVEQALEAPSVGPGCRLAGGRWRSVYDGRDHLGQSALHIDHLVPLFEAWQSGAADWPRERLVAYGNDSWAGRSLVAVTAELNMAKGASGPEEWLPPAEGSRCWYVWAWTQTKQRWGLSYDEAEAAAAGEVAGRCVGEATRR